jgi:hypothetical protein
MDRNCGAFSNPKAFVTLLPPAYCAAARPNGAVKHTEQLSSQSSK